MTLSEFHALNSERVPLFTLEPFDVSWKEKTIDDASCALRESYVALEPALLEMYEKTHTVEARLTVPVGTKGLYNLYATCV